MFEFVSNIGLCFPIVFGWFGCPHNVASSGEHEVLPPLLSSWGGLCKFSVNSLSVYNILH